MNLRGPRFCILGLLLFIGCSKTPYPVAPVHGTVTIDGQPMTGGKIMFAPVATGGLRAGRPAFGNIQPDGSYVLTTYDEGDGAVVGEHWVSILNQLLPQSRSAAAAATPTLARNTALNKATFKSITFPRHTVTVADQENRIDIQLTSQAIASFGKRPKRDD